MSSVYVLWYEILGGVKLLIFFRKYYKLSQLLNYYYYPIQKSKPHSHLLCRSSVMICVSHSGQLSSWMFYAASLFPVCSMMLSCLQCLDGDRLLIKPTVVG